MRRVVLVLGISPFRVVFLMFVGARECLREEERRGADEEVNKRKVVGTARSGEKRGGWRRGGEKKDEAER